MQSDSSLAQSFKLQRRLPRASSCMKELSLPGFLMVLSLAFNVNTVIWQTQCSLNNRLRPSMDWRHVSSGLQCGLMSLMRDYISKFCFIQQVTRGLF